MALFARGRQIKIGLAWDCFRSCYSHPLGSSMGCPTLPSQHNRGCRSGTSPTADPADPVARQDWSDHLCLPHRLRLRSQAAEIVSGGQLLRRLLGDREERLSPSPTTDAAGNNCDGYRMDCDAVGWLHSGDQSGFGLDSDFKSGCGRAYPLGSLSSISRLSGDMDHWTYGL